ncbi:MAG: hypothetical protein ABW116_08985 [Candidatus Sedimenticola sp. 20ELBAFRAG]
MTPKPGSWTLQEQAKMTFANAPPVEKLKIDSCFVRDSDHDPDDPANHCSQIHQQLTTLTPLPRRQPTDQSSHAERCVTLYQLLREIPLHRPTL